MFGIGFSEILIILVIALIFIGPKKLPEVAKTLGRAINEFRRSTEEIKKDINKEVREIEKIGQDVLSESLKKEPPPPNKNNG